MVLAWLTIPVTVALFVWTLANSASEAEDSIMLLSATACAWAIGLIVVRAHFYELPEPANQDDNFFKRTKSALQRVLSWCLALAMTACTFALLVMSYKSISYYLSI